jgi:spore coat protein H
MTTAPWTILLGPIARGTLLVLMCWAVLLTAAQNSHAAGAKRDEAEKFFSGGVIPQIRIEIAKTNLVQLRRNAREYVRATLREGAEVYEDVGIHLKGAAGSFRPIDGDKPAFTLNFDRFVDAQHFHGLDKFSLNNSVQDATYMTEAICAELFLAAGVPTPRTTYARVWLNGRELGLYVLKEGFDKAFLKRHFKNAKGNLYDGGFLRQITEPLERTSGEGDVLGRADLKALDAAAKEPDVSKRFERLEQVLDVDRFLSFAALEMMTWHWDGYVLKKNNYRVYHDPDTGKMVFFPHGMDQMFWDPNAAVIPRWNQVEGLVARSLFETGEGQRRYRERVGTLLTNLFTAARLTNHLNQLRARIRPALEAIGRNEHLNHDTVSANLRNAMVQRISRISYLLNQPEPEPLRFDATGAASLVKWQVLDIRGTGKLDTATDSNGLEALHIAAGPEGRCTASWRTRVILRKGLYSFECRVRTAGVVPLEVDTAKKGIGAGIRQSQQQPRNHSFVGDNGWQLAQHELTVAGDSEEVTLLCELRGEQGEVWFDLSSLKLRRK